MRFILWDVSVVSTWFILWSDVFSSLVITKTFSLKFSCVPSCENFFFLFRFNTLFDYFLFVSLIFLSRHILASHDIIVMVIDVFSSYTQWYTRRGSDGDSRSHFHIINSTSYATDFCCFKKVCVIFPCELQSHHRNAISFVQGDLSRRHFSVSKDFHQPAPPDLRVLSTFIALEESCGPSLLRWEQNI